MSSSVRISPRARADIRTARDWYETQWSGLGKELGRELDALCTLIAERPHAYQQIYKQVRRGLTRRFPYAIYFVLDADRVIILRVLHQARDPEEWRR